jgi:flagellar biosynthesis protein FliP
MRRRALLIILLVAFFAIGNAPAAHAWQEPVEGGAVLEPFGVEFPLEAFVGEAGPSLPISGSIGEDETNARMTTAVEIAILLTILTLLPAILISVTSFTRIVIVLSFVRRSLGVQELPPNPIIIGLALFLTTFVMGPVFLRVYDTAYEPYRAGEMSISEAGEKAWAELRTFLLANTRQSELELFADMAELSFPSPDGEGGRQLFSSVDGAAPGESGGDGEEVLVDDLPLRVVVPAFVLSELKTAFQMGFLLFLPFLVIDLVVASVLISMGMFMLPPVMISTPFKILLFVLVDGWHMVCESLVTSFIV